MRMRSVTMICDREKGFHFKSFAEECFKLCSYENVYTGVKGGLNHNKRQDVVKNE